MKRKSKTLIFFIALPLVVGGLASLISRQSMSMFSQLNKPPLSPPGWLFPVVWTVLYVLMGIASYLVFTSGAPQSTVTLSLRFYFIQLIFNFFWSIFFFNFEWYFFSFFWLLVLWLLIIITTVFFYKTSPKSAYLMLPYILWVTFAGYLNLGIALIN